MVPAADVARKVPNPVIAPAVVPLPALTAQVVGTVAPCTAQPPRMDVPVLAVVVVVEPVGLVPTLTARVVPAARVMAPRLMVTAGVVPAVVIVAPPARVVLLKFWALMLVVLTWPVTLSVPEPKVSAVAGRMSERTLSGVVVKFSRSVPWLIVVEPA